MTGIIWFVQVVHYPLFGLVPGESHTRYAASHQTRTGWLVTPLMLLELSTALLSLRSTLSPVFFSRSAVFAGLILLAIIWLSTALLQLPEHESLLRAADARAIRRLVRTNWIRTVAWTTRSFLLLWSVSRVL